MDDLLGDDLGFGLENFDIFEEAGPSGSAKEKVAGPRTLSLKRKLRLEKRRAWSERQLGEVLADFSPEPGICWHVITGGDVDALSFAQVLLDLQGRLDYLLFSTWCMALPDVEAMEDWIEAGSVGMLEGYVGEIFKSSYAVPWARLKKLAHRNGGRMACFRNHSKVFLGVGSWPFVVVSSSNINTNPRVENFVISVDWDLFCFYKNFFDGINPFNADDFPDWSPFDVACPPGYGPSKIK